MHFQRIFFVVIKLTTVIQFLCLSEICWKMRIDDFVENPEKGKMGFSWGIFDLGELGTQNWGK